MKSWGSSSARSTARGSSRDTGSTDRHEGWTRGGRPGSGAFDLHRALRGSYLRDDQVVEERIERGDRDAERSGEEPHEEVERIPDEAEATGSSQIVDVLVAARPRVLDAEALPFQVAEDLPVGGAPGAALFHAPRARRVPGRIPVSTGTHRTTIRALRTRLRPRNPREPGRVEVEWPRPVRRIVDVERASGFQHLEQRSNQSSTESALRQRDVFDHAAQEDQVDRADPVLHVFEARSAKEPDPRLESVFPQSHSTDVDELRIDVIPGDGRADQRERDRRGPGPATEIEDALVRQGAAAVLDLGDQVLDEMDQPAVRPAELVFEVTRGIRKMLHPSEEILRPLPEFG